MVVENGPFWGFRPFRSRSVPISVLERLRNGTVHLWAQKAKPSDMSGEEAILDDEARLSLKKRQRTKKPEASFMDHMKDYTV